MDVQQELISELYLGQDIYGGFRSAKADADYPHTNLTEKVVDAIIAQAQPALWVEVGTMVGGSAILAARRLARNGSDCPVVCIDPFCGDTDMWLYERDYAAQGKYTFLQSADGLPTIRDRFMANVSAAGLEDRICPIPVTGVVGMSLLRKLHGSGRVSRRPDVIYLDSAHEEGETLVELQAAWKTLNEGGVLFGDDWLWWEVQADLRKFVRSIALDDKAQDELRNALGAFAVKDDGIVVQTDSSQWFLTKGTIALDGATAEAYQRAGGQNTMGIPQTRPAKIGDGTAMDFQYGVIYSSPSTGTWAVRDMILCCYKAKGGPTGPLGFPTSDQEPVANPEPSNPGVVSTFENGSITSYINSRGWWEAVVALDPSVQALDGATAEAYTRAAGAQTLGSFTGRYQVGSDGSATYFTHGAIYASALTGAHFVKGQILNTYIERGGPPGPLGFPTSDEEVLGDPTKVGGGWINKFQHGTIRVINNGVGFGSLVELSPRPQMIGIKIEPERFR